MAHIDASFVHLSTHSDHSLLEGAIRIPDLIQAARDDGQPAIALTDTASLSGALEFSVKAGQAGIQPIIGCQIMLQFSAQSDEYGKVTLLATNAQGYHNLLDLVSSAHLEALDDSPKLSLADLAGRAGGLLALSGAGNSALADALMKGRRQQAKAWLDRLTGIFGDRLYLELHRHSLPGEAECEPQLLELAAQGGIALVATNDAHFTTASDFEAHDALLCIAHGRYLHETDRYRLTAEHFLKSRAAMRTLFADLPEAVDNTIEIARRCHFRPVPCAPILPRFSRKTDGQGTDGGACDASAGTQDAREQDERRARREAGELRRQAEAGLAMRLEEAHFTPSAPEPVYRERLNYELSVIERMNFPGYFLIVADFIKWAKAQGIPVGPGRGSGAASLVAWALTITDIDPLRFSLLFERLLNPERVSLPDFDIDFCPQRRDQVIDYVRTRYGADRVAHIVTFGTLQARAVLRDVGRVLQMPYGQVDRLCRLVPVQPGQARRLDDIIAEEPRLREAAGSDPRVGKLFDISRKLEGLHRHASIHAAGIVIADRPLRQLVPLYRDAHTEMPVTQFSMEWLESAGLVKFDFLGLKTLTIIEKTCLLAGLSPEMVQGPSLPLDDAATFALISRAETVGIFQLESQGMRRAIIGMQPDRIEDIIALVALYRPGPMGNIATYNAIKHGREEPQHLHPLLEPVLAETFGIIVYQEQVLQIAQILAGYSLGEADLLRRAMGKKNEREMRAQRKRFIAGAVRHKVSEARASTIFDQIVKFAGYGFNKAHAAAYAIVAYQTAWLKTHHPAAFLVACMTLDLGNTDKLREFVQEARRTRIAIRPPSINRSEVEFALEEGTIRYALAAVKGAGHQAMRRIVAERANGLYRDMADFAARIGGDVVRRGILETLIAAGAFDEFGVERGKLYANAEAISAMAARRASDAASGQSDFFARSGGPSVTLPNANQWSHIEQLTREYESIGFYLTGHPLDDYRASLERRNIPDYLQFVRQLREGASAARLAGVVLSVNERRSRNGRRIAIIRFSDTSSEYEALIFAEQLEQFAALLHPQRLVIVSLTGEMREDEPALRISDLEAIGSNDVENCPMARIFVKPGSGGLPAKIAKTLAPGGQTEIRIIVILGEGDEVELRLEGKYRLSPKIVAALKSHAGIVDLQCDA